MALALPIVSKFDPRGINDAKTGLDRLGGFAKGSGMVLAGAFAGLAAATGLFAVQSVKAADESWRIGKGLENAVKNAGIFGTTSEDISRATSALQDHSTKLAELTGIDDEVLDSIKRTWMAVPELAGQGTDAINHLAEVTADVAAGTGKDIESIGGAFIKIAGDEESALSKLMRMGITFTDAQKEQYQTFLDANDQIGAQQYLVDQLGTTYAGAAEAMASPLDRISVMWENLQETIGTALMPALEQLVPVIGQFMETLTSSPAFTQFIDGLALTFGALATAIVPLLEPIMNLIMTLLPPLLDIIRLLAPLVGELVAAFVPMLDAILPPLVEILKTLLPPFTELLMKILMPLADIVMKIVEAFAPLIEKLLPPLFNIIDALVPIFFALLDAFIPIALEIGPKMLDLFIKILVPLSELLVKLLPLAVPLITGFGDILKWLVDTILSPLIDALSTAVDWFSQLFGFDGKSIDVNGNVNTGAGGGSLKLASGGIVMPRPGGTMATIGEAGQAEAVIPLDRLNSMMGGGGGGGSTYVVNVNGGLSTSADVGRAVVDAIKRYERVSGPVFAGA